jgi:hypothetical protein
MAKRKNIFSERNARSGIVADDVQRTEQEGKTV